jgi:hypothetical protein
MDTIKATFVAIMFVFFIWAVWVIGVSLAPAAIIIPRVVQALNGG